jgi:hypothetical protein
MVPQQLPEHGQTGQAACPHGQAQRRPVRPKAAVLAEPPDQVPVLQLNGRRQVRPVGPGAVPQEPSDTLLRVL